MLLRAVPLQVEEGRAQGVPRAEEEVSVPSKIQEVPQVAWPPRDLDPPPRAVQLPIHSRVFLVSLAFRPQASPRRSSGAAS